MIPVLLLSKFLNYFYQYSKVLAVLLAFVLWFTGIIQNSIIAVFSTFGQTINNLNIAPFLGVNLSGLDLIGYVNAILPLSEFVGLMAIYLVAWSIVIVLRWAKSFVPTVAN